MDLEDELLQFNLPDLELGDDADILDFQVSPREIAMMLDAPQEPPVVDLQPIQDPAVPQQPLKKRSFFTLCNTRHGQPIMCDLMKNAIRATKESKPSNREEFFANYLNEHMNSKNYPNGRGLPYRWGSF